MLLKKRRSFEYRLAGLAGKYLRNALIGMYAELDQVGIIPKAGNALLPNINDSLVFLDPTLATKICDLFF